MSKFVKKWTCAVWGARYLYIKRNVEKVWGARYLPENTVLKNCNFYGIDNRMRVVWIIPYDKEWLIYKISKLKLGIVKYQVPKGHILWLFPFVYYWACLTTSLQFRTVPFAADTSIILRTVHFWLLFSVVDSSLIQGVFFLWVHIGTSELYHETHNFVFDYCCCIGGCKFYIWTQERRLWRWVQ
jgi:hypothetical protein